MKRFLHFLVAATCAAGWGHAAAQSGASTPAPSAAAAEDASVSAREAAEHARIATLRAEQEARTAQEERACYRLFAVNDCLIKARGQKRLVLADLRRQEVSLNDAARKRRAAQQLLRSDQKAQESGS